MIDTEVPLIAWAMAAADRGWPVHPLRPGSKVPASRRGFHDATTDLIRVERYWSTHPRDNVGIATGAARLLVVDLDPVDDRDGHCHEAVAALVALAEDHDETVPDTFKVSTPRGGEHRYFRLPDDVEVPPSSAGRLAPHVDVRSRGGYVVGPGSVLETGEYTVVRDLDPVDAPVWLIEACRRPVEAPPRPAVGPPTGLGPSGGTDHRGYATAALQGECDAVVHAVNGTRNHTLNRAAFRLGQLVAGGVLDEHEVTTALIDAAVRSGLGGREVGLTIGSGLAAGAQTPRRPPDRRSPCRG